MMNWMRFHPKAHKSYNKVIIPKKNGGERIIYPPNKNLRIVQRKLLNEILNNLPTNPCMGAGKNSSTKKLMQAHVNKKMIVCLDIKNFFPNIKSQKIYNILKSYGFRTDVANTIRRLTTYRGGLPQGAPTSTQLAKLIMNAPVRHIQALFTFPVNVSVWVDDIIISGPKSIANFIPTISSILNRYDFEVNEGKTICMEFDQEQAVLGIRVDRGRLEPDSKFMEKFSLAVKGHDERKVKALMAYMRYICR